jgi:small-conductance mechanosensitive channel
MFERSIEPGDIIEVDNTVGMVQHIGIRSMVIKTAHNKEVIIPNSHFLNQTMTNLTLSDRIIRLDIPVGVSYGADPLAVEQALLAAARHPRLLDDPPPAVHFRDFGANALEFVLLVWTDDPLRVAGISSELRYRVWDILKERGIEIAAPPRETRVRLLTPPNEAVSSPPNSDASA